VTHSDESPTPDADLGFKIAVLFIGLLMLAAALFTLYFLLWDGGGNTS
jgi:hypothetical protein